jgi:hypothetical protein
MTPKERVAEALLAELKSDGRERWFYISMATDGGFHGGFYLQCRGPTVAWARAHALNWFPPNCESQTLGPIADDLIERVVPKEYRYRRLSREDIEGLDERAGV